MKSLEEKMAELKARHEEEARHELMRERILAALPKRPGTEPETDWSVFQHELYGRVATVTRKTDRHSVDYRGAEPWSIEDLAYCLDALEPLPLAKLRYTFTSFAPLPLHPKMQAQLDKSHSKVTITELSIPLTIELAPGVANTATFEWFTELADVGLVEVNYPIPWQHKWMRHDWKRREYMGGYRYEGNGSGLDIDLYGGSVNWGRGGQEYMGKTTLYWANQFTLSDLIARLRKVTEEEK